MAVFFYLFLLVFLPFGVSNYDPNHKYTISFLLEFGNVLGITLVVSCFNEYVIRPYFVKKVTWRSIVAWSIWTLVLLGLSSFMIYNLLGNWHDFRLSSVPGFVANCASVLIFPMAGTFFYFRYQSLKARIEHFQTGTRQNLDSTQLITFEGDGTKDRIAVSLSNFQYLRAQDNYVAVHFVEQGNVNKQLLRASLSKLVNSIEHPAIVRCHRSYVINLANVRAVKGGKNDTVLYLEPADVSIPVSRSYRDAVLEGLHRLKIAD